MFRVALQMSTHLVPHLRRMPVTGESVVRLTIVGGAVTSDVSAVLKSPGGCGEDCGGGEGEEGIDTPAGVCACVCASDIACANVTSVLSSTRL
jgi:hypothetical protein